MLLFGVACLINKLSISNRGVSCRLGISSLVENILVADLMAVTLEFGWFV